MYCEVGGQWDGLVGTRNTNAAWCQTQKGPDGFQCGRHRQVLGDRSQEGTWHQVQTDDDN